MRALAARRGRAAGVAARAARRRAAVGGAGGVAGGDARAGLPERAASVPDHARAVPGRAAVPRAARRSPGALTGVAAFWRLEFAAYLALGVLLAYAVRGGMGARGGALRGRGGRASPPCCSRRSSSLAGPGRRVRAADPLPAARLRRLPVAAVPARPTTGRSTRARPAASCPTPPRACCCSTCRSRSCWRSRARSRPGALRFRRAEDWWRVAPAVFALGMLHYLLARADLFHTAPLAVMVGGARGVGRAGAGPRAAPPGRRPRSPPPALGVRGRRGRRPPLARRRATAARRSTCPWPTACGARADARATSRRAVRGDPGARAAGRRRSTSSPRAQRPRHRRQPAALRARRPAEPDALRHPGARRGHVGAGPARDRRRPRAHAPARSSCATPRPSRRRREPNARRALERRDAARRLPRARLPRRSTAPSGALVAARVRR